MSPGKTIPGMGGGEIKEDDGEVNSNMIRTKNFHECHNVPPAQQ
jgi:hypothetical protein